MNVGSLEGLLYIVNYLEESIIVAQIDLVFPIILKAVYHSKLVATAIGIFEQVARNNDIAKIEEFTSLLWERDYP